ncbi:uncharacterized protein K441DRAFT_658997 [Cenococcum geophilum 1.58]|uniref:uncharacterized protein n=1 Tax=Cenococcum geophilum 1.58 TaxID=794803 RepID=UPI00358EE073|nr:hypothetical protein K441DRAFT_658997 [Cenococcum geophilum 1.58]
MAIQTLIPSSQILLLQCKNKHTFKPWDISTNVHRPTLHSTSPPPFPPQNTRPQQTPTPNPTLSTPHLEKLKHPSPKTPINHPLPLSRPPHHPLNRPLNYPIDPL